MNQPRKRYLLDGYALAPDEQLLSRSGQTIHLPKKPFQVLTYLVEHRDRFISRAELLDLFWDGKDVYDDALRKCVGAIRKALDDQSDEARFIETRWGVGYRYIGPVTEQIVQEETITEIEKTRGLKIVFEEEEINDEAATDKLQTASLAPPKTFSLTALLRRRPAVAVLAFLFLATAIGAAVIVSSRRRLATAENHPAPIRSIAVLPLKNLSNDSESEYFSDGITEALINSLSGIEGLKVISRGSVFAFKGQEIDPREVKTKLSVGALLEGSVLKSGERVRVNVRLVSTEDGRVLWASNTYDRPVGDIFTIQDEIARRVATGLKIRFSGEGEQRLARRYTDNVKAYQAYLKGRYFLNQRTPEGISQAINYFQQAIEMDPKYALAYAWLSEAYDKTYWYGRYSPPADVTLKEKEAATKAVALDDSLGQAHLALAAVYANGWDLSNAMSEAKRAVEIGPEDADAHHRYAYCLIHVGKPDEAVAEIQRARDLDPLNIVMNVDVGEILLYARRYDEAIEALKQAIEMDATRGYVHYDLAVAFEQKGMEQEAFGEQLKSEMLFGASPATIAALEEAYAASGLRGFWRKNLEIAKEKAKRNYIAPIVIAKLHARIADADQAFYWLEKAYAEHAPSMIDLKVDPVLDPLRSDPRYIDLLRRVGFQA
jgi:TolB-like protein/DNA-binding winged helix-turn-helix (wHTH) protein/Tfp pilus assembly protein PilF